MYLIPIANDKVVPSSKVYQHLGYNEHRAFKKLIKLNLETLNQFGEVRVAISKQKTKVGGRPNEDFMLNLNHLFFLVGVAKNTSNSNKRDILKILIESHAHASLVAILDLISSIDIEIHNQDLFVYVAKEDVSGRYKIGISKDPENRVKALNTGNPERLRLVHAYLATDDGFKSESLAHAIFEEERLVGEWFCESIDLSLLPSYSATCKKSAECDCLDCSNYSSVFDSVYNKGAMSRDKFISIALKKTSLSFNDVSRHIDALEDTGVITFK